MVLLSVYGVYILLCRPDTRRIDITYTHRRNRSGFAQDKPGTGALHIIFQHHRIGTRTSPERERVMGAMMILFLSTSAPMVKGWNSLDMVYLFTFLGESMITRVR